MKSETSVLISGSGPVGLLLALGLGKAGIDTLLVEKHPNLQPATRACVYMPVVVPILTKLGIFDKIQEEGFFNRVGIVWRDSEGQPLAQLPLDDPKPDQFGGVLQLGQWKLAQIILNEIKKYPNVEVCYGAECVGIQDQPEEEQAKVMINERFTTTETLIKADYVIGADGSNSSVRRMMCIPFEGFSYPWRMIGADVLYDFMSEENLAPLNFIVDPVDWGVIAFTGEEEGGARPGSGKPPLWRIAYIEPAYLTATKEGYMSRAEKRIPECFMKHGSKQFKLLRAEPYVNSQKVAAQGRKGRVLLTGDALHSNNPIGGLGLTGGICDAFAYGNALVRVLKKGESDSLLTDCANSRRNAWLTMTNVLSQGNIKRLYGFDEEGIGAREEFFSRLKVDESFSKDIRGKFDKMLPETFE
ncbi:hypothetical protein B7463_g4056, partial [Scytalidium lignicola]